MSKSIQIRNVPDDVHHELKVRAAKAGLSLSDFLLREVEQIAERPLIAQILRRDVGRGSGVTSQDIVDAVRSGRDRDE